ncbi:MAG TPA: peptide chain release factor N(5)-glutamine methyltransferase [Bryobacteraceae bacterium]|nr:peptide chain release factor N(5)-glutamine methyltransferase [Bryobacteraceae bacterium]
MTLHTALLQGTRILEEGGIAAPRLTAEVLLSFALRRERIYLYAHPEEELSEVGWIHYGRYLHQRLKGMPTQYITRRQEFYGREFAVSPAVLIPRPETEHLVEAAIERVGPGDIVLDVGTGSGAIAITLALETRGQVFAVDISRDALAVGRGNAGRLNAAVGFLAADLCAPIAGRSVDVLVSNPPYVPRGDESVLQREVRDYEPHVALFAGATGTEMYERLVVDAARVLKPGGWLMVELGYNSLQAVRDMLGGSWRDVEVRSDLAGLPRVLVARLI